MAYHGILPHQDYTLSTESLANFMHLLRADIIDSDNEDAAVLFEETFQLVEVPGLVCALAPHVFL